ncbi:MAG: hypothetical protein ABI151_09785 [Chitinophagaceae bacterium]
MNENLKQRFLDFEMSPPPSVWIGVATYLDEQNENMLFREKVLEAELAPPHGVWNHIFEDISIKKSTLFTVNFQARKQLPRVAAIFAAVILVGSFLLINNKTRKGSIASTESSSANVPGEITPKETSTGVASKTLDPEIAASTPKANNIYSALKFKKKTPPGLTREFDQAVVRDHWEPGLPEPSVAAKPIRNESGEIIQDINLINKANEMYVNVTGPNGAQTRISAKFAKFLLYLNGDNDTDLREGIFHKSFLESLIWKARFQNWRTAISQNAFVPTSTNFMDILQLKDLILQQKDID